MKHLIFIFVLSALVSCGGNGGGSGSSENRPNNNTLGTDEVIECFDDALSWIDLPPQTHTEALNRMEGTDVTDCGGVEEMRTYIKAVISENPDLKLMEKK